MPYPSKEISWAQKKPLMLTVKRFAGVLLMRHTSIGQCRLSAMQRFVLGLQLLGSLPTKTARPTRRTYPLTRVPSTSSRKQEVPRKCRFRVAGFECSRKYCGQKEEYVANLELGGDCLLMMAQIRLLYICLCCAGLKQHAIQRTRLESL